MNLLIILQVEYDRLICASVNPNGIVHYSIIAYYIIYIYPESEFTLITKTVLVLTDIVLVFIVEKE